MAREMEEAVEIDTAKVRDSAHTLTVEAASVYSGLCLGDVYHSQQESCHHVERSSFEDGGVNGLG